MEPTSAPGARRRLFAERGRGVLLFVVGALIDICGVVNVPGGATLTGGKGGQAEITAVGTLLALVAVACWATVFWRRSHPLLVLVAGGVVALVGMSYLLLLIGAVCELRRHPERLRLISATAGGVVVLYVVREAFTPWGAALPWFLTLSAGPAEPLWGTVSAVIAVVSLALATAVVFASQAKARAVRSDHVADYERQRADVLGEQMVRQAERERIARDMHDALAHRLSVVSLHAGALEGAAGGQASDIARTVREQTHAALEDMRGLIGDLRSGPSEATPSTMRAIGPLLSESRAAGAVINAYVLIESPERASAQFDSGVHRIVQEALTNAMKHATTAPIDVHVHVDPTAGARIRVVNALRPRGAVVPGGGHGVLGMRERAAALGGTAWIGPYEGEFIVDVAVPWQER